MHGHSLLSDDHHCYVWIYTILFWEDTDLQTPQTPCASPRVAICERMCSWVSVWASVNHFIHTLKAWEGQTETQAFQQSLKKTRTYKKVNNNNNKKKKSIYNYSVSFFLGKASYVNWTIVCMIRCMFDNHVNAFVSQFDKLGPLPLLWCFAPSVTFRV